MFDLDKHREDLIKLIYDIVKIWLTLSIIGPFVSNNLNSLSFISSFVILFLLLITAIILRQGGQRL
jgi:hypothetical protein